MSIKIEILDPQQESPQTLRTLAHLFHCLASDRDGKPLPATSGVVNVVSIQGTDGGDLAAALAPLSGNAQPDAPGASNPTTPPPPPPLASAPAADGSSSIGELDKNGLYWDPRIHSGSKGKNQDGSWKALRGVDKDLVPTVEAEIRAKVAASGGSTNDAPPPPPPIVVTGESNVTAQGSDSTPPPPPLLNDSAEPPLDQGSVDFKQVFTRITALQKHAKGNLLPQALLAEALTMAGIEPPTMAGFMKPEGKALAPELLEAVNLLVAGSE